MPSLGSSSVSTDRLLEAERRSNRILTALHNDDTLRELLLRAANSTVAEADAHIHLLLPQSVTLDDVRITPELLETHLVYVQQATRDASRSFTSLNGLCGAICEDGAVTVHGRLKPADDKDSALIGSVGGWERTSRRHGVVPQLESQIVVLRESMLSPSARLPLRVPVSMLLISDPLFFPGCGWKHALAVRKCSHRFARTELSELALADLPQLLDEYQILARAWQDAGSSEAAELNFVDTEEVRGGGGTNEDMEEMGVTGRASADRVVDGRHDDDDVRASRYHTIVGMATPERVAAPTSLRGMAGAAAGAVARAASTPSASATALLGRLLDGVGSAAAGQMSSSAAFFHDQPSNSAGASNSSTPTHGAPVVADLRASLEGTEGFPGF